MDAEQLRLYVIRPPLRMIGRNVKGFWSIKAENLLLGTAAMESLLKFVRQFNGGPAVSLYQIEPKTYHDTIRYLNERQPEIREEILKACFLDKFPSADVLIWNLRLATLMARVIYWMVPESLPESNDLIGQANYYIKHFHKGTNSTIQEYLDAWYYVHGEYDE